MKRAKYICFEGTEGVGKTTQIEKLYTFLTGKGYKVLSTKDVGSPHLRSTQDLRKIMLDNDYDQTLLSRELISNGMRSIHLEKLIMPALSNYDYIIQDRGFLSSVSYGEACIKDYRLINMLNTEVIKRSNVDRDLYNLYDSLIILRGDSKKGLKRALDSKQEFQNGDAMESLGNSFMEKVDNNFKIYSQKFQNKEIIDIDGKSIEDVFELILSKIP